MCMQRPSTPPPSWNVPQPPLPAFPVAGFASDSGDHSLGVYDMRGASRGRRDCWQEPVLSLAPSETPGRLSCQPPLLSCSQPPLLVHFPPLLVC
jgi:hypothetical protein